MINVFELGTLVIYGVLVLIIVATFALGAGVGRSQQTNRPTQPSMVVPMPTPCSNAGSAESANAALLSAYEEAIFAEARFHFASGFEASNEAAHLATATQLHAEVRRLRTRVRAVMAESDEDT